MTRRRSTTVVAAIAAIAAPALTTTTTYAQDAVQWRVEDGGNGHWYRSTSGTTTMGWYESAAEANAVGAHLATVTSSEENAWLFQILGATTEHIGAFQDTTADDYSEPSGGWRWITGEPWAYQAWNGSGPDNNGLGGPSEEFAHLCCSGAWNDIYPTERFAIFEWSADCNGDGIVDYGQIFDGTFADCDGNGVPDECDLNAVFAETQPGTPAGPTDYLTFDVSSLPNARDTVTIEISALGELAGPARFLFVYIDEPTVENRIGIVFGGGGANCLGLVETLEMPVGGWNDAGLDGSRSIIIAGSGLDPICGEDAYTGINVMVPIEFTDCDKDGVWDACTIADGTTPDADGDGTVDDCDQCPTDPEKIDPGVCGCGVADLDTDDDGLADCVDPCPNWPYECSEDGQTIVVAADQSIQLAIDVIPVGGTIELAANTYLPPATLNPNGRDFTLRGAVDPEGAPLTVIDGQNAIRILAIDSDETAALLIENLVIRNGYSGSGPEDVGGGVLIFNADATIDNCIFEDNTGTNYGGALAIHNDDFVSDTTVSNCIFRNNTAVDGSQPSGIGGRGGAVSVYRGNPVITSCIFEGNLAQDEGGAIHDNSGAPSVSMCEFDGNTASEDGGALYLFESTASFVECDFTGSVANGGGGAVFHDGGGPSYRECTFESNSSTNYYGGGMFNYSSTPTVSECLFVGNTALSGDAGGMYNFNGSDAILTNCTFRENQSGSGGGIRNNNSSPTLTDCVFDRNSASSGGGGVYCDVGSTPTLTNCVFLNNTAPNGGGIQAVDGSDLVIQESTFEDNTASTNGGGIQVDSSAPTIIDCVFARNDAGNGGGGLSNFPSGNTTVIRGVFEDNAADTGGGAANSSSSFPSYEGCTFTGNVARGDGAPGAGAIYSNSGSNPSILDSTVCGNLQPSADQIFGSFTDLGGNCIAEFCDSDKDGVLECDDVCPGEDDFLDTDGDGTPDCIDPCPAWPDECSGDGQTIFVAVGQSIQEALIAVPTGGTVEIAAGTFKIDEGIDGVVFGFGDRSIRGASNTDGEPTTIIDAGAFGRIMTLSLGQTNASIIENLVLVNGRQAVGGAVSLLGGSNPTFRNCWFQDNSSALDGGAIYTAGSSPIFESCRFIDNLAEEEGGAVYATDASVTFVDCDFDGNTALGGGAIVFEASPFNEVTSSTFRNNTADRGGAIYLGESYLFLNESSVSDNVASISGAAIMVYQSTLELDSSIVCGNFPADQISGTFQDLGNNCIVDDCGNDLDGNDVPDACDPDCDGDGVPDAYEIATGTQLDCDIDGIPDECSIEDGMALDCNENGIPDTCDIDSGGESDANDNDIPDSCDIAAGDLNVDGCVDAEDLGLILALWGIEGAPVGDLDGDGVVQASDLGVLLAAWRPCDP